MSYHYRTVYRLYVLLFVDTYLIPRNPFLLHVAFWWWWSVLWCLAIGNVCLSESSVAFGHFLPLAATLPIAHISIMITMGCI